VLFRGHPSSAAEPPRHVLEGQGLKLTIHLPDPVNGYYRGTRFDWSGLVTRAEFGGHVVFSDWLGKNDPNFHSAGSGTSEEFTEPLGYAEAPVGGTYVKIGIGELEKGKEPKYHFNNNPKLVRPGTWQVTPSDRAVEFRQELSHPSGYGYRYVKRVALRDGAAGFVIERTLTNTGTKRIDTEHFGHHFLTVDGAPIGPGYALRFGFPAKAKLLDGLGDATELRDGRLTFLRPLDKGQVYLDVTGWNDTAEQNQVTVEHAPSGVALRIAGDRPLSKFNVWTVKTTLCPEPFVRLSLEPGRSVSWATRYEFNHLAPRQ
jgi:hypothetical protein